MTFTELTKGPRDCKHTNGRRVVNRSGSAGYLTTQDIVSLCDAKPASSDSWIAKCPAHNDSNPSLSIKNGNGNVPLVYCHAGCEFKDIMKAIRVRAAQQSPGGSVSSQSAGSTIVEAYDYRDEHGNLKYQVVRLDPKSFRQRAPDLDHPGGWVWSVKGVEKVLYRLQRVLAAIAKKEPIYILEGEKDVAALESLGVVATCNAGGAGKWQDSYTESLTGADVVIIADKDDPGRKHAQLVAGKLVGKVQSVKIVELPARGGATVKDAHDWVQAGGTLEELRALVQQTPLCEQDSACSELPIVTLPGGSQTITDTAIQLSELLKRTGVHYVRAGLPVKLKKDSTGMQILDQLPYAKLTTEFEAVASLQKKTKDGPVPAICTEQAAKTIVLSDVFTKNMPAVQVVSPCPVMTEVDGELRAVAGYDSATGILAGGEVEEVPLDESVIMLTGLLSDFKFASEADRSRAVAAFIAPAMVFGGLLGGRCPIDLSEADESQAGKGTRNKATAAIYSQGVRAVTQRKGGVGSMEEVFSSLLMKGANFVAFDNIRGKLDSPLLESYMTEPRFQARVPHMEAVELDARHTVIMMTSNKADMTKDLANRCSCTRILKQPPGYQFEEYPEGGLIDHIKANQPRYLGAVFTVIGEWYGEGKQRTDEARHDFKPWVQTLDWIVQNIFGLAPLMDGHKETQQRMTSDTLNWLRDVAIEVVRRHKGGQWLRTHEIVEVLADTGIEIPGLKDGMDPTDRGDRKTINQALGRKLLPCFVNGNSLTLDSILVERRIVHNGLDRKPVKEYAFTPEPDGEKPSGAHQAQNGSCQTQNGTD